MAILRVSNQAQLNAAVREAGGGDTIMLASGSYADLDMNGFNKGEVTVTSASPGDPAVIRSMLLKNSSNVEVRNVELQSGGGGTPFIIDDSRNVTLDGVEVQGRAGGYGTGIGLRVKGSQDVALLNSEVSNFERGLSYSNNSDIRISNNDFRGMSNDSMILGGIRGAVIEGNDFRQMNSPSGDRHKDMIQFFTGGGDAASSDVVIRNNVIENPEVSHAIFFGNALAKGGNLGAFYRDILIEDNYIRSAHTHGITMDHGAGVTIRDNTLVANGDEGNRRDINIPLINVSKSSIGVTIQSNTVASVPDGQGSWNVSGNATGSRDLMHWQGAGASLRASSGGSYSPPPREEEPSPVPGGGTGVEAGGDGGRDVFRIVDTDFSIENLSFAEGDTIMFLNFGDDTFAARPGGNGINLWDDGGSAEVDSLADLQELVAMSSDVSARTSGDLLILEIGEGRDVDEVRIEGLGQEFRAEPDLF